jgi:hypothetical protein
VGVLPAKTERKKQKGGGIVPGKKHGPSVKKPKVYEALKKKGMSKARAARISNAQAKKSR